jgi:hypothetical protein
LKKILDHKSKYILPVLIFGIAIIFSFGMNTAFAIPNQDKYVSNTGSDSWSGNAPVWNGTDGPKQTIKNATAIIYDGGTVYIANGTYNENDISVASKSVNYVGSSKLKTIINGNLISRMFSIGQGASLSFTDLTLTKGSSSAIFNYGGTLSATNCIFKDNIYFAGGAIHSEGQGNSPATVTILNCLFSNNTANMTGWGGAILSSGQGITTITGSDFVNNKATLGAAIYQDYGSITANFNRFVGNTPVGSVLYSSLIGGYFDATLNWWGSNSDPSSMVTRVTVTPWLVLTSNATPSTIGISGKSKISANLLYDSGILTDPSNPQYYYHDPNYGPLSHVIDGITATFSSTLGTVSPLTSLMVNGTASTTFIGTNLGLAAIHSVVDSQTVSSNVNIINSGAPVITSTDPLNKAINVALNKIVKITFNKAVQFGTAPWIEFKTSTGTAIAFTSSIVGNVLSLTPNSLLTSNTKYYVVLHSSSVTDLANVGIVGPVSFSFTTDTAPVITSTNPVDKAVNVPLNKVVKITFNKSVKLGTNPWIEFKTSTGTPITFKTSITGNVLSIAPSTLISKTKYTVVLHSGSVTSLGGAGIAGPVGINFTTA